MDLNTYLDGETEAAIGDRETWTCDSDGKAAWLVRMIARARARKLAVIAQAEAEIGRASCRERV